MTHLVLLSRDLPMPTMSVGDEPVLFETAAKTGVLPAGAKVYLSTAVDVVDGDLIARLPERVGLIANLGVGTDNIDLEAVKVRGIQVSNTPVVTEDTADHAFALILAACRQIGANERFIRAGNWSKDVPLGAMGASVHGKTLGLVGFGAIGQAVARRAVGFDMTILYWNRSPKPESEERLGAKRIADLDELLSKADIVSLHTPLTRDTRGLIDGKRLEKFKHGAVLVNTGRGSLVDEASLVTALRTGRLLAAGLDVFESEPDISPQLLELENVVLTPHIGSATAQCRANIAQCGLANVVSYLETGEAIDRVI